MSSSGQNYTPHIYGRYMISPSTSSLRVPESVLTTLSLPFHFQNYCMSRVCRNPCQNISSEKFNVHIPVVSVFVEKYPIPRIIVVKCDPHHPILHPSGP